MADEKKLASELESREVAEQAREQDWEKHSFARMLFEGNLDLSLIQAIPDPDPDERERAAAFLAKLETFDLPMTDLTWFRLRPWRRLLAQAFEAIDPWDTHAATAFFENI